MQQQQQRILQEPDLPFASPAGIFPDGTDGKSVGATSVEDDDAVVARIIQGVSKQGKRSAAGGALQPLAPLAALPPLGFFASNKARRTAVAG